MIAVDTNILVYAHRADSEWHEAALSKLLFLAESRNRWAIPWPCIHEFLAIVTHPKIYIPPTPLDEALECIAVWVGTDNCVGITEGPGYFEVMRKLVSEGRAVGGMIHDARIAALCRHHGIEVLWSSDRDFSRFPELKVFNPLVGEKL